MTAHQPPRPSANTAAMAKSAKDVRSPVSICPLMKQHVQLLPLRWQECTAAWASGFIVASKGEEALKLLLPISDSLQTSNFALAFTIAYQLEAERDLIHPTHYLLQDLHITWSHFARVMNEGTFTVEPAEKLPLGIGKAPFMLFKKEDLVQVDV